MRRFHGMQSNFHSSRHEQCGRLLLAGASSNWSDLVGPLVDEGFQIEMVPSATRAGIRCVEQVVDAVLLDLIDDVVEVSNTAQLLQRVSKHTKIVVLCESSQDVPPTLAAFENVQRVVSDVSPNDFVRIIRTAVRVAQLNRERTERIDTLKSLATEVHDEQNVTVDLEKLLSVLQEHAPRTPFPKLKLPEISTLTEVLARSLDPLTASRAAVDFVERCLPGAMIVSWLVGSDSRTGLAACAGNGGSNAILSARLLSDVETLQLPRVLRTNRACVVDDVRQFVGGNDFNPFAQRWAMLAPCRANGECFAAILIVGPAGTRPTQAESGLGDVCQALATQLAFDARIHRRIFGAWPNDSCEDDSDLFG